MPPEAPAAVAARSIAILGPTGSRKTDIALAVAEGLGGEIVSCDSMQVYQGMRIGTCAPLPVSERGIVTHLVGCLDIAERYDANRFVGLALPTIEGIRRRGRIAILCGGTGLYARALIYGLSLQPSNPDIFREVCRQAATTEGLAELREELTRHAPAVEASVLGNPRRLIRAVEILRVCGQFPARPPKVSAAPGDSTKAFRQFVILPPDALHRQWIQTRTRAMLAAGWVEAARELCQRGLLQTPTAYQALGYRDIARFLASSRDGGDAAPIEQTLVARTWAYVRRQRTWFRHQHPGACQMPHRADASIADLASAIVAATRHA